VSSYSPPFLAEVGEDELFIFGESACSSVMDFGRGLQEPLLVTSSAYGKTMPVVIGQNVSFLADSPKTLRKASTTYTASTLR